MRDEILHKYTILLKLVSITSVFVFLSVMFSQG